MTAENLPRPVRRPRRLRQSPALRGLVRETRLTPDRLVLPLFLTDGHNQAVPIASMPGQARLSIDRAAALCAAALKLGVQSFALFPAIDPRKKTPGAEEAVNPGNLLCRALRSLKEAVPQACLITDVALDPYNSLGHDGLVSARGEIVNDQTVDVLAAMSVLHARCGADVVAPSDMMDGRVAAIRTALDRAGHENVAIISYTAKYASAFYGPFREALDSAPVDAPNVPKDKATYQMDPANAREAAIEAALDEAEGADILMVKPALPYLDIIARLRSLTHLPIAAYHVSGEYAMIHAAAQLGWLDLRACMTESLTAIARAGADVIFTYAALDYARWWRESLA
jgi:porphobilinogen synthase